MHENCQPLMYPTRSSSLVCTLSGKVISGQFTEKSGTQQSIGQDDDLHALVHIRYRNHFVQWMEDAKKQTLSCAEILTESGASIWIELSRESDTFIVRLEKLSDRDWRRRLLIPALCIQGLKHDLSNRLFLLAAIPELATFEEPAQLIEDLCEDLPATLSFFATRVHKSFTEMYERRRNLSTRSFIDQLPEIKELIHSLGHLKIAFDYDESDDQLRSCSLPIGSWGMYWCLSLLSKLKRESEQAKLRTPEFEATDYCFSQDEPLIIQLNYTQEATEYFDQLRSGPLDQTARLCFDGPALIIQLTGALFSFESWFNCWLPNCIDGLAFQPSWTGGVTLERTPQARAQYWMESWVTFGHMSQGNVGLLHTGGQSTLVALIPIDSADL